MFAPRRHGAPLLAGLAAGAVLIGATAVASPESAMPPAVNAALGASLVPSTAPAEVPRPGPRTPARYTVPAPVPLPTTVAPPLPEPTEPPAAPEVAGPTTTPDAVSAPSEPTGRPEPSSGPAEAVVAATNVQREAAGCGDLRIDLRLEASAQGHAADMSENDYFSHTSQDGREFDDRITAAGYLRPGGENVAVGQETAEEVVQDWMDSPGHRRNILDCDFVAIGVGYEPRGNYWVQNFGY